MGGSEWMLLHIHKENRDHFSKPGVKIGSFCKGGILVLQQQVLELGRRHSECRWGSRRVQEHRNMIFPRKKPWEGAQTQNPNLHSYLTLLEEPQRGFCS